MNIRVTCGKIHLRRLLRDMSIVGLQIANSGAIIPGFSRMEKNQNHEEIA
jgi:hypothetical protein